MKGLPDPEKRKAGKALLATLLIALIYLASGVQYDKARGTCYTEKRICHGLPIGNTCIGVENLERNFDEQCSQAENIQESCTAVRNAMCPSQGWREVKVQTFSCGFWDRKYDMGIEECGNSTEG